MKYKWLNKKNNKSIIVFFNGWGMDESVVAHLKPGDYDVIMIYDYNTPEFDLSVLKEYENKHLAAWSMGVMAATLFDIDYVSKTAVNGTLKPIDDEFGIPCRIYDLTLKRLDVNKFMEKMFEPDEKLPDVKREYENQKKELAALKNYKADLNFKYDKIIISDNDKIIPTQAQVRFWGKEPSLHAGHCPFYHYKEWEELL